MTSSPSFVGRARRSHVRGQASVPLAAQHGEPFGHRLSWLARPLRAVNNQHSHLDEEFVRMQSQLSVQVPQTSHTWETHRKVNGHAKHHVFHDTELHPLNRQPQRHVHHDGDGFDASNVAQSQSMDLASAVEFSYQYSSNIVNYRKEEGVLPRMLVHRARVLDYPHPSLLARDLMFFLINGGKLLLELPDEPAAVSSLMTALGRVAMQLRTLGLATALDPVYDPATVSGGTCQSTSAATHASGHASSHQHNHHHHHSGSGSPSSSHDFTVPGVSTTRRCLDGGSGVFVFCARAVPIPPSAVSVDNSIAPASYTVGRSIGQEVLPVGPSVGIHSLLPTLLRAILRDGLVTLRCCWFDEDLGADSWPEDDRAVALSRAGGIEGDDQEDCEEHDGCDASNLWSSGSGSPGRSRSPDGTPVPPVANVLPHPAVAVGPAGSLVRVPCVLRAIFKLDRQLRGLDLGGLVVLPHTFARSCRDSCTQLLHLDIVIA